MGTHGHWAPLRPRAAQLVGSSCSPGHQQLLELHHTVFPLDPTFEADPIGRRLECRPKKGFILIDIEFPLGPPGVIKFPLGPMGPRVKIQPFMYS